MKIEDIKIGKIYQLTFTPKVSQVKITTTPAPNKITLMTTKFHDKYGGTPWKDYQDRKVIALSKSNHFPPGVCFHFESDPDDLRCTIYPDYFKLLNSTSTNPASSCHCNIWVGGCTCGAFKAEKKTTNT